MKKLVLSAAAVAAALLTGCASQRVVSNIDKPAGGGQAKYIIPEGIGAEPVALKVQYAQALSAGSQYRRMFRDESNWTYGVRVDTSPSEMVVNYLNIGSNGKHVLSGAFGFAQSIQGKNIVVDVTCPTTVKDESNYDGTFSSIYKPWITPEQAATDLNKICTGAVLRFPRVERGEVNVTFPDNSVYANFARKLKAYDGWTAEERTVKKDDIQKFKWFNADDGGRLGVTVFPYRNGSKVVYVWQSDVTCRGNGTCSFDPAAGKRLQDKIVAISND
jgi:hypothetical protein